MSSSPYLIAIAGGSCSGKSSIAARLVQTLPGDATVLGMDSYYRDFAGVPEDRIEVDVPEALDRALFVAQLSTLAGGGGVERPVYDYATHSRRPGAGVRVEPGEFVLVEGLFALYWPEVRSLVDLGVFVTIDHGTALARRIERDVRERGRTEASVRTQYDARVRPNFERLVAPTARHADLVVDGRVPVDESARLVLERVVRRPPPRGAAS